MASPARPRRPRAATSLWRTCSHTSTRTTSSRSSASSTARSPSRPNRSSCRPTASRAPGRTRPTSRAARAGRHRGRPGDRPRDRRLRVRQLAAHGTPEERRDALLNGYKSGDPSILQRVHAAGRLISRPLHLRAARDVLAAVGEADPRFVRSVVVRLPHEQRRVLAADLDRLVERVLLASEGAHEDVVLRLVADRRRLLVTRVHAVRAAASSACPSPKSAGRRSRCCRARVAADRALEQHVRGDHVGAVDQQRCVALGVAGVAIGLIVRPAIVTSSPSVSESATTPPPSSSAVSSLA